MSTAMTTAQVMGALYKELVKEGIPVELADDMVRDAARTHIAQSGIRVTNPETAS